VLDPTSGGSGLFAGYAATPRDEAVGPHGRLRGGYERIGSALEVLGAAGLARSAAALAAEREARGVVLSGWRDGRPELRPFAMDPVPRVLPFGEWSRLAAGVEQRHRALIAFLADVYRAAGRRRGDPDQEPDVVRAGVLPDWAVAAHPARDPDAVGLAWRGQPRAGLAAVDVGCAGDQRPRGGGGPLPRGRRWPPRPAERGAAPPDRARRRRAAGLSRLAVARGAGER
jgi:uncharacterized circularly permuted ATP-grasp superfamily protein